MRCIYRGGLCFIIVVGSLASCVDLNEKVEEKLNLLDQKTMMLDSIVNKEVNRALALDTLLNLETEKVKKLDSLLNTTSSKIDSISKGKIQSLQNIIN